MIFTCKALVCKNYIWNITVQEVEVSVENILCVKAGSSELNQLPLIVQ